MLCERRRMGAELAHHQTNVREARPFLARGCFRSGNSRVIPSRQWRSRGAFFVSHGLDVADMQRGCRPEAVEDDADGAAIAARTNDGPFPADEIWASHRAECAHPDAGPQRKPSFG